ncbi:FAD binding domain-containing protein [Pseudenhygromyxa sp. WMMC2535]|uniref:FAD binding domain-containing protein n=1 Tax=Pseudenhygromyxa sp. WMMC2535 TaxID=2712867 RepID=UPI001556DAC9|nr:FAD binding domain-containing protein [Pseudenhygromyxa sp. WMMC2535]NVB38989.1 FAD binding domain-containing protein [Pseudenhygromyxa sp. WMMC2535]
MQPFALIRPESLTAARELVRHEPAGRALRAGGVDLMDRMKEGLDAPGLLVELSALAKTEAGAHLRTIEATEARPLLPAEGAVEGLSPAKTCHRVGAMVTLAELAAAMVAPEVAALGEAASEAATPGIRNIATVGGNLLQRPRCWYYRNRELVCLKKGGDMCLALTGDNRYNAILGGGPSFIVHPSSLATALTALDAFVATRLDEGEPGRSLPMAALFVGPHQDPTREHALEPGELLVGVYVPKLEGMRSAYQAAREKQSHDWPLAEAAARMRIAEDGTMREARVALGHVAPVPWLAAEAAAVLEGQKPSVERFAEAANAALAGARPLNGNAYKVPLARGLIRSVLHRASGLPSPD